MATAVCRVATLSSLIDVFLISPCRCEPANEGGHHILHMENIDARHILNAASSSILAFPRLHVIISSGPFFHHFSFITLLFFSFFLFNFSCEVKTRCDSNRLHAIASLKVSQIGL